MQTALQEVIGSKQTFKKLGKREKVCELTQVDLNEQAHWSNAHKSHSLCHLLHQRKILMKKISAFQLPNADIFSC